MAAVQLRLRRRPPTPTQQRPSEPSDSSYDDSNLTESSDDWQPDTPDVVAPTKPPRSGRINRTIASSSSSSSSPSPPVTVSRASSDAPEEPKRSIRLTVKMPSSRLREVTGGSTRGASGRRSHNIFTDDPIVSGPRNSRSSKRIVEINTSEEEELDDEEEDEADEDEDLDADGDVDMDDVPSQPPVSKRQSKPAVTVTPAGGGPVKSVEAKEMEVDDDEDDEELSELESDAEGEPDDQEESGEMGGGAEDEELDEEDEEDEEEEEEIDSDEATPATGSRGSTPDLSKMTKRQRGSLGNDFLQLPMEPQVKKHLTAEEHAMRRAEMARRRKNLSEKRNEEEKMDTINRLLKKQAPKRRGRAPAVETAGEGTPGIQEPPEPPKPDPTMVRWISSRDSCKVAVPQELFGTPAGRVFGDAPGNGGRKLVEEV